MSSVSYYYQQVEMILIKCSSCLVNILQTKTAKSSHSKFQVLFFDVLVSSFGSQNEIRYKGVLWKMEGNDSTNISQAPRREIFTFRHSVQSKEEPLTDEKEDRGSDSKQQWYIGRMLV